MKIAIADDEESEQKILIKYITEWAEIKNETVEISAFQSSESFLFSWEDEKDYRLLVLDIEMGEMNGMELAHRVRAEDKDISIIFVTGYDEYMQYGYDVSALHYLIKPVNKEKLFQVLDRLKETKPEEVPSLLVNSEDKVRRIKVNTIMYAEAAGHGSVMHTVDEVLSLKQSIGEIEKQMIQVKGVVKCHRAYLVNMRFVSAIQNAAIVLDNGEKLPVSRMQVKRVQQEFLTYYKNKG